MISAKVWSDGVATQWVKLAKESIQSSEFFHWSIDISPVMKVILPHVRTTTYLYGYFAQTRHNEWAGRVCLASGYYSLLQSLTEDDIIPEFYMKPSSSSPLVHPAFGKAAIFVRQAPWNSPKLLESWGETPISSQCFFRMTEKCCVTRCDANVQF